MKKGPILLSITAILCMAVAVMAGYGTVSAYSSYLSSFLATYPSASSTQLNSCGLCHVNPAGGGTRNSYGTDYASASIGNHTFNATLAARDSDGDTYTNLTEINAGTFPGDAASHPTTTTTDTIAPSVTAFSIPVTSSSLTVSITSFTASDNVGVTGYLVNESSTKPLASAAGWSATAPASYTATSAGTKILYAWAKDAAGNVSASRSATVTITVSTSDTIAPSVTAFSIPVTSSSLTVSITSFTASDNVGVTGYLVNESSTKPLASAAGWSATAPASYTATSAGTKILYAWAKDAAGNVSASRSATVTITVSTSDTIAPTVTAFSVPSSSSSLKVSITSFTATDNVGVTGYIITTSSTKPLASAAGWSSTPPSSYTFTSTGSKILYAWAKDAAGNVSASRSATVNITATTTSTGISGVVRDIVSGAPIYGAVISNGSLSTSTNSLGAYSLKVSAGKYTLNISKSGYLTTYQVATVGSGSTVVDWALTKSYGTQAIPATGMSYVIFAWNDLGMHCDQDDYSYFAVLPPFNTLHAQVFRRGSEGASMISSGVTVSYAFPKKTNSALHTNFWAYAPQFGWNVPTNVGITGTPLKGNMKLDANGLTWVAEGIPITPYDDDGTWDPYGTAVITVKDSSGRTLQTVNVVAPVSTEMQCSNCHGTANPQLDILQRHDAAMGTTFVADKQKGVVHLCSECHQDNALGMPGKPGIPSLSLAMHDFHQDKMNVTPQAAATNPGCYNCHPGTKTQCLRGIMARAGKSCEDCHGDMAELTTSLVNGRQAWLQEPKCADCHDSSHAENANTLYRNSLWNNSPGGEMNGRVYCEACHNSPHAILTTTVAADASISKKFQGDSYWIWNCAVCHGSSRRQAMHVGSATGTTSGGTTSSGTTSGTTYTTDD